MPDLLLTLCRWVISNQIHISRLRCRFRRLLHPRNSRMSLHGYLHNGPTEHTRKQQRLSLQTKLRLYSSLVLSVLLYGSETWTLRKTDSSKVQAFHMMSQHRILGIGIKWYDHIPNSTIRERTGFMDLPIQVADRRHSLFGHICRLSQEAPAHRALKMAIDIAGSARPATDWKSVTESVSVM